MDVPPAAKLTAQRAAGVHGTWPCRLNTKTAAKRSSQDTAVLGYRDGVRNLREIGEALFDAIVVGGARADQGMISFAEALGPGEADAIHAWVIARANEDYAGDAGN